MRSAILIIVLLLAVFIGGCTLLEEKYSVQPLNGSGPQGSQVSPPPPPQEPPAQPVTKPEGKEIVIDSHTIRSVTVRNVGKYEIRTAELSVYLDTTLISCDWNSPTMPIYTLRTCSFSGTDSCGGGMALTVSGPSNSQTVAC